jgi:succinate dehydrogenase / fumarate reductase cytochrome b subunit
MAQNGTRPVFLNLLRIRLPIGGIVSILHRVTGVLLALSIPLLLYLLQQALTDAATFAALMSALRSPGAKLLTLLAVVVLAQHFFSGLRHLLLDLDVGTGKTAAQRLAWLTFAATGLVVATAGACL